MYNEESIMNAIAPAIVMLLEMLNQPVETMKASIDRLTVEIMELETKMENKINAAISEVEVSTEYDELRRELVDAVDTMNEELYELRTDIENMETQVEQNEEYARNNNYTLTQIRDALNDNHDSL